MMPQLLDPGEVMASYTCLVPGMVHQPQVSPDAPPGSERALYLNVASRELQTQQALPPPFDGPYRYLHGRAPQLVNFAYNWGN